MNLRYLTLTYALVSALTACVADDASTADSGADASKDATLDSSSGDGGADACAKTCDGGCVALDDPAFGCTPTSCAPCTTLQHVTKLGCANGACTIGTCDPAYDDLDRDAADGCEIANPLAFNPSKLALWLKGDKGVVTGGDGGVTSWANQAGDGGVEPTTAGSPTVDTTSWPSLAGAPSVKFAGSDTFGVDLSAMASTTGFTTFLAFARFGDKFNLLLGSGAYPSGNPSCCAQAGQAFQVGYLNNTQLSGEVYCNNLFAAATANTSSGYQPGVITMWFDPGVPLNYFSLNGTVSTDSGQCPHALSNLSAPGILGGIPSAGPGYTGLVGELVVYSALLSTADRGAVESYLKTKWKTP